PRRHDHKVCRPATRLSLTGEGALLGTVAYMAPEQARDPRQADRRSDIYSLGYTLYYLLTGTHAFAGPTASETLANHSAGRYRRLRARLPDVPPMLESTLDMMIATRPEERFQTASIAAAAMLACRAECYPEQRQGPASPPGLPRLPGDEFW